MAGSFRAIAKLAFKDCSAKTSDEQFVSWGSTRPRFKANLSPFAGGPVFDRPEEGNVSVFATLAYLFPIANQMAPPRRGHILTGNCAHDYARPAGTQRHACK